MTRTETGRTGTADRGSLAEQAYRQLRRRIVTCSIEPGEWLTEARTAAALGVGKTPTREALGRLASEGFVRPMHRRGYQVTPITVGHVLELFEAFGLLLPEVGVLVAERASTSEKRRLAELTRAWVSGQVEGGEVQAVPYAYFVELSRNQTLTQMTSGVVTHLERVLSFAHAHGAFREEEYVAAIDAALAALQTGDRDLVRVALAELTEIGRRSVIDALHDSPSLLTAPVRMRVDARAKAAPAAGYGGASSSRG